MEFSCRTHPDQVYLFYCISHDVPCCSECKRISHQPTCDIEIMDPYANEKDFGLKMANLLKRMNKTNFLLDELYKEFYQSRKHLLKQKDKFEIDLTQFRQQIDEHIDEVENNIRDHFSDMYNNEVEVVKQRETGALSKKDVVSKWVKDVEKIAKKETSLHSYVYLSKISNSFSVIEKHAMNIERKVEYVSLSFAVSNDYLDFLKGLKLAHTHIKRSASVERPEPNNAFPPTTQEQFQINHSSLQKVGEFGIVKDTDFPSPSDMKVLPNGDIMVINLNNRRLIIYDQYGLPNVEMELSHNPRYLTYMADNMVAMTLANERKVVVLDIEKRLVHRQIHMEDECYGIAYTDEKLIINGKTKGLFILNSQFKIENKLPDITGKLLLCGRSNGSIVCGMLLFKTIFCIDIHGITLFEIIPMGMEYLNGVSVTDQDVVYVTGFLSNTVHKIETQGESSAIVLDKENGINLPRAVCYDNTTQSVIVMNNDGQNVVTCSIKK